MSDAAAIHKQGPAMFFRRGSESVARGQHLVRIPIGNAEAAGAGSAAKSSVSPRTIMPTEQLTYAAHPQASEQLEIMQPADPQSVIEGPH